MLYVTADGYPRALPEALPTPGGGVSYAPHDPETIAHNGYSLVPAKPGPSSPAKIVEWDQEAAEWAERDKSPSEVANEWQVIRERRDRLMAAFDWRILRHQREVRMGVTPTEDIADLDAYMAALASITDDFDFPWNVEWPVAP